MNAPLIEVKNLYKSFDNQPILNGVDFSIYSGEFITLLGGSGCGKTTLLRLIAGFEKPERGEILMCGLNLIDKTPQSRNIHTVFQSYALFPHLNVFDNVAFPLVCKKTPALEVKKRVEQTLKLMQLHHLSNRPIQRLSGGQQQRVAIARAIINEPKVLLLDEPLSSLDYRLRKTMQYELKQLQKKLGITFIFVTHDQEEALSLSDRIILLNEGRVEQVGTPREIYETPKNRYVAQFIGETNCFDITVHDIHAGEFTADIEGTTITCKNINNNQVGEKVHLIIRPEDIRVQNQSETNDSPQKIAGQIIDIVYKGTTVDLKVQLKSGKIISASEFFNEDDDELEFTLGETVWLHWLTGWEVVLPYEE